MRGLLLRFLCLWLSASGISLSGQSLHITSAQGDDLVGVQVWSEDKSFNEVTDLNGNVNLADWNKQGTINLRSLGFVTAALSFDQLTAQDFIVILQTESYNTEEVVIFGRHAYDEDDIPLQIETIKQEQIQSTNPQTAADALSQHGEVYVQKSQLGGGSPIIRGFEANRVLLVLDGVRLNNAIYRNGHLQNAITVDPAIMGRMDVIFGPNSLMYGSDALGGVVHFQTKEVPFAISEESSSELNYYGRYATANQEKSAHIDYSHSKQKFSTLTSVSFSDFEDLRAGGNRPTDFPDFGKRLIYQGNDPLTGEDRTIINDEPNVQVGTAYHQLDILQKFSWLLSDHEDLKINLQYSTSSNVPRYDNLSELRLGALRYGEWFYGPQKRLLSAITYKNYKPSKWYDNLGIVVSYQRIDEDRNSRLWNNPVREVQQEDVNVWSTTIDFTKGLGDNNIRLDYGLDMQHNSVKSLAFGQHIVTGQQSNDVLSRYGSDSNNLSNMGAYLFIGNDLDKLNWSAGLRYSMTRFNLSYSDSDPVDWPSQLIDGVEGNNSALTFSTSAAFKLTDDWTVNSVVSSAYRSPNIDDLSRIRVNGQEISFPNIDLNPERSLNAEIGIQGQIDQRLRLSSHVYVTRLSDAIVRRDFTTPDGSSTYINRGDTLLVVANQNTSEAIIYGMSTKLKFNLTEELRLDASINMIRGDEIISGEENVPFSHIPPTYGQVGLYYDKGKFNCSGVVRYNGFKSIDRFGGPVDNPEFATPIGALSWSTINLYSQYQLSENISINLGVENLMDLHYRPFASGLSAPGRNVILALRGQF